MNKVTKAFKSFIQKETLLCIAFALACISSVFVKPDREYIGYIDLRVLGILLSLMLVVAGLKQAGLFDSIGASLLKMMRGAKGLSLVLVLLCFFTSMLITNDVALITFVPFAIYTLKKANKEELVMKVVVLQTLAANLGSMLTPVGNPQNLYIYQTSGMKIGQFFSVMAPYTLASLILLVIALFVMVKDTSDLVVDVEVIRLNFLELIVYGVLFVLCLMVVLRLIPYWIALGLVVIYLLIFDRRLLAEADYSLLFTFVFFFIFTGNLGRISAISEFLGLLVSGHEIEVGIVSSQIISNVPATLLLAPFTDNFKSLLIGVNLGGMGTLIASMASLISYKKFVVYSPDNKGKYFRLFTVMNLIFLVLIYLISLILRV